MLSRRTRATPPFASRRHARVAAAVIAIALLATTPAPLPAQPLVRPPLLSATRFPSPDSRVPTRQSLALSPRSLPNPSTPPDPWFGRDKALHFSASAAIQLGGYGSLRATGMTRSRSMLIASVVTAAAGIGKELWDGQGHGDASARDLVWDGLGLLAGSGLARIIDPP